MVSEIGFIFAEFLLITRIAASLCISQPWAAAKQLYNHGCLARCLLKSVSSQQVS